ncbi:signal peptidase II [Gulosibacter molinativorax]|uniref:Lipoprotein signal peptidase n=1 Tax=Gulosibacter molinativorax TaxID=256821 RepID=A0ABT7C5D2_9MICO|nr:signal peptidase II [Gulosibacter molinativorax]MDJ1370406.1 signal peptidase II [Gulosibacter molinativorax]QUY61319.1 Lipoprotein signal peptidase [Gulosibacter molinativorax]
MALLTAIAVAIFAADQIVKQIVVTNMSEGETISVIDGVLQWHFVRNSGAAFSMASGQTWLLTIVAVAVVIAVAVLARKIHSARWATVFGLVLGGALGNLFDRLFREPGFFRGHVIDYISTPWLIPAIYNIADMAIVFGMIAFVLLTILDVQLDGTRPKRLKKGEAEASSETEAAKATDTEDDRKARGEAA